MISTRISSKGQIVLPKAIRDSLGIEPGTYFNIELKGREIILRPLQKKPVDSLYGRFSGENALNELEKAHLDEISNEYHT